MSYRLNRRTAPYLFLLPSFALLLVFSLIPFVQGLYFSLTDYPLLQSPKFVGLDNFARLFRDPLFVASLKNTLVYMIATVALRVILGLAVAVALNGPLRGRVVFRAIFYLPVIAPLVTVSVIWRVIFDTYSGVLNAGLELLGIAPIPWLTSTAWAMPAVIIMSVWKTFGWNTVIFLAGLQGIPQQLYEAAAIDGASKWRSFIHITLPLLRPTILLAVVTSTISASQVFDQVYVMTGGGPGYSTMTLGQMVYTAGFQNYEMGYASAVSVILLLISLALTLVQFKFLGQEVKY
ncbi:MAG: sugar ABC transporter permease [Chloroflexota bacterium]|nr:MAG: lactose ABC transporter permease [Chloroflexota bacterium]